jgi:hypothetical protein
MHSINSAVPARAVANEAEDGLPTIVADLSKTRMITNARACRPGPAAWVAALLLTGALSACAEYHPYEKCGKGGCAGDADITANVQGLFAQHPELEGPDQLYVETTDHVVYLSGTVETGLHRDIAASVAREVNGVSSIVNNIAVDK